MTEEETWKKATHIFTLEGKESVPGQSQQIAVTKSLLTGHKDLEKLEVIHDYFAMAFTISAAKAWIRKYIGNVSYGGFSIRHSSQRI